MKTFIHSKKQFVKSLKILLLNLLFWAIAIQSSKANNDEIKIHYLGHASFIIEFNDSINVLTDFGTSYCWGLESPIFGIGDFIPHTITISHRHDDHYNADRIPNEVSNVLENLDIFDLTDLKIRSVRTCENTIGIESSTAFIFEYKGFRICHLGDAQAEIMNISDPDQQESLLSRFPGKIDVLLMTIEGINKYIREVEMFIDLLQPGFVIPMHYWTPVYKEKVLEHMEDINNSTDKNYEIIRTNDFNHSFLVSDTIYDVIKVISLDPFPYGDPVINNRNIACQHPVSVSSFIDVNHCAERTTDGFAETCWRSMQISDEWFMIDFEETKNIDTVIINNKNDVLNFQILTSVDSVNWDIVFSAETEETVNDTISLGKTGCRYLKLNFNESESSETQVYLYEVEVFEYLEIDTTTNINSENNNNAFIKYFPNPTDSYINISYFVPENEIVLIGIYDNKGRNIKTLVNKIHTNNINHVKLNTSDLPEGTYFIRMNYHNKQKTERFVVLRQF